MKLRAPLYLFILITSLAILYPKASRAVGSVGGCDNYSPSTNGSTVSCNSTITPAATAGVISPFGVGSTTVGNGIKLTINSGTTLDIFGSTVGLGSGAYVINNGVLNTNTSSNGYGISSGVNSRSQAGGSTIINNGSITTGGASSTGIIIYADSVNGAANSITNTGTINTTGNAAHGILVRNAAAIAEINNSGSIAAAGTSSNGVQITGAANFTNSGIICPSGITSGACATGGSGTGNGIQIDNNANTNRTTITNTSTGLIGAPTSSNYAIYSAQQPGVDIYNYGRILGASASATAINFAGSVSGGSNNTVTLYGGSTLLGGINFNKGNTQETLTYNGLSNSSFSNAVSGLNVINATNGANVTMNSSTAYELVSGKVAVDGTSSLNIAGVIQDQSSPTVAASSIEKTGSGTLTLSGANTYTGGTTVTGGTLAGNTTSLQGAITNNSIVNFNQATAGTYSGLMSGTGALLKTGDGNLTLTGHNTYSGGTTVSGGMLTGDNLSLQGNITNNATVNFNQLSVGTYSGVMSGTGSLLKTGGGTLTLSGANTYSGGTTVSAGTLSGNATSIQGNIVNNGTVQFSQSGSGTYSGTMSGSGNLTQVGNGVLNLTGPNTYSGGTNLNAGAIAVGNNTALGSGGLVMSSGTTLQASSSVNLANNISTSTAANIDTNGNNLGLSGIISGTSDLNKNGAGVLTLAGINSYSGSTNINAGGLLLTGSIGQPSGTTMTTVSSGASLQGNGTINGSLTNAGTVAPSFNGAQANLTINGNYVGAGGNFVSNVYAPVTNPIADTMTISGGASGTTGVTIVDKGGLGNRTSGPGIEVVHISALGSSTTPNAFALNQRVASGAFEYKLVKGDASGSGNSWYLRTDNPAQPASASAPAPSAAALATPAVGERIEVSVYPALPTLVQLYSQTAVDTLDQRRGDLNLVNPQGATKKNADGWARIIGKAGASTPSSVSDGPKLNFNTYALQFGADLYKNEEGGSRTYVGPYVTIGGANGNTSNQAGTISTGSINGLQAYSAGLYATHFAQNGLYVDALAQGSKFSMPMLAQSRALSSRLKAQV